MCIRDSSKPFKSAVTRSATITCSTSTTSLPFNLFISESLVSSRLLVSISLVSVWRGYFPQIFLNLNPFNSTVSHSVSVLRPPLRVIVWRTNDSDLPNLHSITFGHTALNGLNVKECQSIDKYPYNYMCKLIMKSRNVYTWELVDLSSLTTINGDEGNFEYMGSVELDSTTWLCSQDVDVPQLLSERVQFGKKCFDYTYSLQSDSRRSSFLSLFDAPGLESAIRSCSKLL